MTIGASQPFSQMFFVFATHSTPLGTRRTARRMTSITTRIGKTVIIGAGLPIARSVTIQIRALALPFVDTLMTKSHGEDHFGSTRRIVKDMTTAQHVSGFGMALDTIKRGVIPREPMGRMGLEAKRTRITGAVEVVGRSARWVQPPVAKGAVGAPGRRMATVAAHVRSPPMEVLAVASSAILEAQLGLETVDRGVPKSFGVVVRAAVSWFTCRFLRC